MPNPKAKNSSSKKMMKQLCKLGAKRSAVRKKAAALLVKINEAERPDEKEIAHQLTSPNIHHYIKSTLAYEVLENMMGHMLGGLAAIMAYDSVESKDKSVMSTGFVWCVGALLGTLVNREIMQRTGISFMKNTHDLQTLNTRHDELKQEIETVKSQLGRKNKK